MLNSKSLKKNVRNIFKGLFVDNEKKYTKLIQNATDPDHIQLLQKIISQDNSIVENINENYTRSLDINESLNLEIMNMDELLSQVKCGVGSNPSNSGRSDFFTEIDSKINEFTRLKEENKNKIRNATFNVSQLEKKKRDDFDYLKNFSEEKKVWLDKLDAFELRDLTSKESFNTSPEHDYEYKVFELIFSGLFLGKLQDKIDKKLSSKGKKFKWECMDEKMNDQLRGERFAKHTEELKKLTSKEEIDNIKNQFHVNEQKLKMELNDEQRQTNEEWNALFKLYWTGKSDKQIDPARRKIYEDTTREVVMEFYKNECYNAWRFKNAFLGKEEFVFNDKFKDYILALSDVKATDASKQEEEALARLMTILDNLKDKAEMLTIGDEDKKIIEERMVKEKCSIVEALKKVNEVRELEGGKAIKRKKIANLYDVFLPAMIAIRTVIFLTIGNRRIKGFKDTMEKV